MTKDILFVLGTRPEAIKLAPLILAAKKRERLRVGICITAQHREMLDEVLSFFGIQPDFDLNVMTQAQGLTDVVGKILTKLQPVYQEFKPDVVVVQGDTNTAFAGALAAFYQGIRVAHVEAGLRSFDIKSPFPEEANRVFISKIADFHFAPTEVALQQLQHEGIQKQAWNVGNTVIDALLYARDLLLKQEEVVRPFFHFLDPNHRIVLLTSHRRENFGEPLRDICRVVQSLVSQYADVQVVYPVHPNPNVREIVFAELSGLERVHLIDPLSYPHLVYLMQRSHLILTDSGGIQEEAPSLGKPIIVLREVTERMEGVHAGTAVLAGTSYSNIWRELCRLLDDPTHYLSMANAVNPYGDGHSSERILDCLVAPN